MRSRFSPRLGFASRLVVLLAGSAVVPALASAFAAVADDAVKSPIDVEEWSVWVSNPAETTWSHSKAYRNAMPKVVGTLRPVVEEKNENKKFAVEPVSVVQLYGEPTKDVDIDLRVKKGLPLGHWPEGTERSGRIQWFKTNLLAKPGANNVQAYLPETHWWQSLRKNDAALWVERENKVDRFLAYDVEVFQPVPIRLRGGPDEYSLQNLTTQKLIDVAVISPEEKGIRIGWLDALPAAVADQPTEDKKKKEEEEKDRAKKTEAAKPGAQAKAAEAVFDEADKAKAEEKDKDKKPEPEAKPLPAEADADIKARVDQVLNRPINMVAEPTPRREVIDQIATQSRLRIEIDEPTLAKEKIDLGQPMTGQAGQVAPRDALAEALGPVGLSYRVADDGSLFITTAARLADDKNKKTIVPGPPIKLTMAPAIAADSPSFREVTRDALARRWKAQGMREESIRNFLDHYEAAIFRPKGLIVLVHVSPDALDESVTLDVFPPPRKVSRVAMVVTHGIDPRLQDRARTLIADLGDVTPKKREAAEAQLTEMGSVAIPVLEDALKNKDLEVVFRAERLLLKLNRQVP